MSTQKKLRLDAMSFYEPMMNFEKCIKLITQIWHWRSLCMMSGAWSDSARRRIITTSSNIAIMLELFDVLLAIFRRCNLSSVLCNWFIELFHELEFSTPKFIEQFQPWNIQQKAFAAISIAIIKDDMCTRYLSESHRDKTRTRHTNGIEKRHVASDTNTHSRSLPSGIRWMITLEPRKSRKFSFERAPRTWFALGFTVPNTWWWGKIFNEKESQSDKV